MNCPASSKVQEPPLLRREGPSQRVTEDPEAAPRQQDGLLQEWGVPRGSVPRHICGSLLSGAVDTQERDCQCQLWTTVQMSSRHQY